MIERATASLNSPGLTIVHSHNFLSAVRDAGYRSLDSALSELIDNSLEAGAGRIEIAIEPHPTRGENIQIAVIDDGRGMTLAAMHEALRFGGSSRFDMREGLGRFGMGLPSASLSQARRADVYSWRCPGRVIHSRLDLDELTGILEPMLPKPRRASLPVGYEGVASKSGTLVVWSRLDRVDLTDVRRVAGRLRARLGRIFRTFLWSGRRILVDGQAVEPVDPTFLRPPPGIPPALQYGETMVYEVDGPTGKSGQVIVRFAELPVRDYGHWTNDQKRDHGVSNGAGVSIVRGGREIDYGWFFMRKRRENYDDWWRAEISFDPVLDELFGVTPVKQGIRPSLAVQTLFGDDLRDVARALNHRARQAHAESANHRSRQALHQRLSDRERLLRPVAEFSDGSRTTHASTGTSDAFQPRFRIVHEDLDSSLFFASALQEGTIILTLNTLHPFYRRLYRPFHECGDRSTVQCRERLDVMLLALARAALPREADSEKQDLQDFLMAWSRAITIFCED